MESTFQIFLILLAALTGTALLLLAGARLRAGNADGGIAPQMVLLVFLPRGARRAIQPDGSAPIEA